MVLQSKTQTEETNTKEKSGKALAALKSAGWLLETVARGLAGYVILTNFNHMVAIVIGIYFTATGAALLVTHFVKAYVK